MTPPQDSQHHVQRAGCQKDAVNLPDAPLSSEDAKHMSFIIAGGSTLEKLGSETATRIGSKAGVAMVKQHVKGATLQFLKELFKKIGVTFTQKALIKAIPLGVGVVVGSSSNYFLAKYVGKQAVEWFTIERNSRTQPNVADSFGDDSAPVPA